MIDHAKLTSFLRHQFVLDWDGVHGAAHWARVRRMGAYLADVHGAEREVVTLFALLHDSCREDEYSDPEHGRRAARLVREMNGVLYQISDWQEDRLAVACEGHSRGSVSQDVTVQVCWDADRLDLGRLGMQLDPARLGTEAARQLCLHEWPFQGMLPR